MDRAGDLTTIAITAFYQRVFDTGTSALFEAHWSVV
ncbi:MAG: Uncharacterised protein [Gammaproteobacteria bacterium]|nr:MAG: Uncharacterised protein [Gammaproteobacteria bacterium]